MKYQGKLLSKENQTLLITVNASTILEAEEKIYKIFEERYQDYHFYRYELLRIDTIL